MITVVKMVRTCVLCIYAVGVVIMITAVKMVHTCVLCVYAVGALDFSETVTMIVSVNLCDKLLAVVYLGGTGGMGGWMFLKLMHVCLRPPPPPIPRIQKVFAYLISYMFIFAVIFTGGFCKITAIFIMCYIIIHMH